MHFSGAKGTAHTFTREEAIRAAGKVALPAKQAWPSPEPSRGAPTNSRKVR